jgi:hypothetical protein
MNTLSTLKPSRIGRVMLLFVALLLLANTNGVVRTVYANNGDVWTCLTCMGHCAPNDTVCQTNCQQTACAPNARLARR